jgi:hypothetical protein
MASFNCLTTNLRWDLGFHNLGTVLMNNDMLLWSPGYPSAFIWVIRVCIFSGFWVHPIFGYRLDYPIDKISYVRLLRSKI